MPPTVDPATASAEILRRRRMRENLVAYAENIQIPGAPLVDDSDEAFELHDGSYTTLAKLDDVAKDIEGWARKKEKVRAVQTEYGSVFSPIGSSMALHHRILLEKIQTCMETRYGRLMVFMPPGSAKSTYATVVSPTWAMGKWPGLQIILASYATPIAKKLGSKGRYLIEQPAYGGAFRDSENRPVTLSKSTQAKEMWETTNGSQYMSGGLLSGLTGNRAGGVIVDDPVKGRQAAESKAERQSTREAYDDDLTTRLLPGAWMIVIQTRWAPEDLAGSILPEDYSGQSGPVLCRDGMVWEILNIPGKAIHDDDPLGRAKGEYLWPEWFDKQFWEMYEPREGDPNGPSERRWSALFQQNPRPDSGNMFEEEWFNRYDLGKHPHTLNMYCASDYATKEDEGDFTEHGVAGLDHDGHLWFTDWFYGQVDTAVGIDELLKLAQRWGVRVGFGESGIIRHAIEPAFKRRLREKNMRLHIKYLPNAGKKTTKALSFQSLAKNGKVWIPRCPWGDRLIALLVGYHPGVPHDDFLDVGGLFGRALDDLVWSKHLTMPEREHGPAFGSWGWLTYEYGEPKNKRQDKVF